jgi:hypothetical protein
LGRGRDMKRGKRKKRKFESKDRKRTGKGNIEVKRRK